MEAPQASPGQPPPPEPPTPQEENDQVRCIACLEEIPQGASLCKHCKSYQKPWRNWIPHIGLAVALITIASAITGGLTHIYRNLTWEDSAKVVYLKSPREIAVLNNGSGTIFLESITINSPGLNYYYSGRIGATLKKDEFFSQALPGAAQGSRGVYLKEGAGKIHKIPTGYTAIFYLDGDQELDSLTRTLGPTLPVFPGTGKLTYRSTRNARQRVSEFAVTGLLLKPAESQQPASSSGKP